MPNIRIFQHNNNDFLGLIAKDESHIILSSWISIIAKDLSIDKKIENQLLIVVDEIFSNIVKYANVAPDGLVKVEIILEIDTDTLELKFTDKGLSYNPLEAKTPDINATLDDREIGGLGIFIVNKIMDSVEYKREDDSNILILKKSLKL